MDELTDLTDVRMNLLIHTLIWALVLVNRLNNIGSSGIDDTDNLFLYHLKLASSVNFKIDTDQLS